MELSPMQYEILKEPIRRYRLTMSERFMVYNDNDIHIAKVLRNDLGINAPLPKCSSCDGLAWSEALFGDLNKLFIEYERIHQS